MKLHGNSLTSFREGTCRHFQGNKTNNIKTVNHNTFIVSKCYSLYIINNNYIFL